MRLGLGNTLVNGGGSLNPDGLSLDLQFATDKTLTARKGPTPTFTRASTATFVGSNGLIQSAAINQARFDHDPVTLESKGLLIEESRTNLTFPSENFASASWTKTGGSLSSVANVRPDGNANSELFSEDGTTGTHRLFQVFGGTIGTIYTLSVFFKFNGRAEVTLENRSIAGNPFGVFNIQNGTIGLVSAGLTAAIQAYPNGWYRCSITGTATLAGGNYLINGYSGTTLYTGLNGPAFYLYGAQVEAGAFPTSYIPTTTASVVRSADVCSITGSAFTGMYNQLEGTIISNAQIANLIGENRGLYGINNNGAIHGFLTFYTATGVGVSSQSRNAGNTSLAPIFSNSANTPFKRGLAYNSSSCGISDNGSAVTTTSVTTTTQTMLTLQIGNMLGGAFYWSGHITSIRYFKKRLPNAKLQTLTT